MLVLFQMYRFIMFMAVRPTGRQPLPCRSKLYATNKGIRPKQDTLKYVGRGSSRLNQLRCLHSAPPGKIRRAVKISRNIFVRPSLSQGCGIHHLVKSGQTISIATPPESTRKSFIRQKPARILLIASPAWSPASAGRKVGANTAQRPSDRLHRQESRAGRVSETGASNRPRSA